MSIDDQIRSASGDNGMCECLSKLPKRKGKETRIKTSITTKTTNTVVNPR